MISQSKLISISTIVLTVLGASILIIWFPSHLAQITALANQNKVTTSMLVILWRVLAIVIPPLPGGIVTYALIPVWGWFWSLMLSCISVLIGTSISFFLARHFREPLVKKFVPLQHLAHWESKIHPKTKFWAFLVIRITTGPVLDFVSYVAGLSKITFRQFFLATLIALLPDVAFYYFGEKIFKLAAAENPYIGVASILTLGIIIYIISKTRMFTLKKV